MEKIITYNMKTHVYGVELYAHGKVFVGQAKCNREDWDNESELFGYGLATDRAMVNYYKWLIKRYKKRYKILNDFVKSLECYKDFDASAASSKHMYHQLNMVERDINQAKMLLNTHLSCIKLRIKGVKGKEASSAQ